MMTALNAATSLEQSFEELRLHARTIRDIENWLKTHPDSFPGIRNIPSENLDIRIGFEPNGLVYNLRDTGSVFLEIHLTFTFDTRPAQMLEKLKPEPSTESTIAVRNVHDLELPLADWPVATALATGLFFHNLHYGTDSSWVQDVIAILDPQLQKHFPAYTLDKIGQLQKSELLVLDEDDLPHVDTIIHMLFDSRQAALGSTLPLNIPEDMTP